MSARASGRNLVNQSWIVGIGFKNGRIQCLKMPFVQFLMHKIDLAQAITIYFNLMAVFFGNLEN